MRVPRRVHDPPQGLDASTAVLRAPTPDALAGGILEVLADPSRKLLAAYASIAPAVRSSVATSM